MKCLDTSNGSEKWTHTYAVPPVWHVGWGELGYRATPTITDQYVYHVGTFGHGMCFDRKSGKVLWSHDFRKESPYLDGSLKNAGNLEWKGFNGSLLPQGDKFVMFYWQGGNPAIPAWEQDRDLGQDAGVCLRQTNRKGRLEIRGNSCAPGTRGPGLVFGSGLPIVFQGEECVVIHGNRQWKILRRADGKQVWNWECAGRRWSPQPGPAAGLGRSAPTFIWINSMVGNCR